MRGSAFRNASVVLVLGAMAQDCPDPTTGGGGGGGGGPVCGDGVLDAGEICDDGNTVDGDGCDASCAVEAVCLEDLGPAKPFNVMAWTDVSGTPDFEGKVAVGGILDLFGFSIGFQDQGGLAAVAGTFNLVNGMVWGDAVYADAANLIGVGFGASGALSMGTPIDWAATELTMKGFSLYLVTNVAPNGAVSAVPTGPGSFNYVFSGTDPDRNVFSFDGTLLADATGVYFDVPAGSDVIIHASGSAIDASSFDFFPQTFPNEDILWNFYEADTVYIQALGWAGTILAPYADVTFDNGQLDGQAIVNSAMGSGQYHWKPFSGTFECGSYCGDGIVDAFEECDDGNNVSGDGCSGLCALERVCIEDLGPAAPFNVFVFDDFSGVPDVEGKVAAGDDLEMTNFSVGLKDQGGDAIVAGDITLANGMVYGNAVYSGTSAISAVGFLDGYGEVNGSPIDFAAAQTDLIGLSGYYAGLPTNGATVITPISGGVLIDLTGTDPSVNVFEVLAADLSAASSFSITVPPGSAVIVNLVGTDFGPADFDFFYNGVTASGVLFNAYQATTWDMARLGWRGSLLAPFADVTFNNGQMDGQLIAHSVSGKGEYHWVPFEFIIPCP